MRSARAKRVSTLVDVMTGISLMMKGLSTLDHGWLQPLTVVAFGGGALILAGSILRRRLEPRFHHFHSLVLFIEGLACGFVGAASAQRGTDYIQFAWLIAAVVFIVAAIMHLRRTDVRLSSPQ